MLNSGSTENTGNSSNYQNRLLTLGTERVSQQKPLLHKELGHQHEGLWFQGADKAEADMESRVLILTASLLHQRLAFPGIGYFELIGVFGLTV